MSLTPQEQKILKGMAEGSTTQELAVRWGISSKTVEYHRARIIKKLGTKQVAIICQFAILTGWATFSSQAIRLAVEFGGTISPADALLDKISRAITHQHD